MAQMTDNSGATLTSKGRFYQIVNATTYTNTTTRRVCRILVSSGTGACTVYDNSTATGTPVWSVSAVAAGQSYELDCPLVIGLTVVAAAATIVTVVYG